MKITQRLISASGVHSWMADWCAYEDPERDGPPKRKPTRVVGSGVWLDSGPPGREIREYVVLSNPHCPESVGYWCGFFPKVWDQLQGNLLRGKLEGSGAKLRRVYSVKQLDESSRPQVDDALRLCGSGSGSQEPSKQSQRVWESGRLVKQAMQIAAEKVGEEHLAAMPDPAFRAQAARWRSGDEGRKFSAVLARFLSGLSTLRPGRARWLAAVTLRKSPPLPLTRKTLGNYEPALWWRRWTDLKRFFLVHWRAMWVLLVILCFLKLVATCLAVFLRMVVRLLVAIVVRVFRAAWFELDGALGSLAGLSCTLEAVLGQHLEAAFGDRTPSVTPVDGLLDGAGQPQVAQSTQTPPPSSSQFFTQMLLVVNLVMQLRTHRQGG